MAELSTAQRERLHDSSFAYIDRVGERHLPINDEEHVRNAIARFGQTDFEDSATRKRAASKILEAARRHGIEVEDDDEVARVAHRHSS
jgi:hypothetical protein